MLVFLLTIRDALNKRRKKIILLEDKVVILINEENIHVGFPFLQSFLSSILKRPEVIKLGWTYLAFAEKSIKNIFNNNNCINRYEN